MINAGRWGRALGSALLLAAFATPGAVGAEAPATNLDILRGLMGQAAAAVKDSLALVGKGTVSVTVLPRDVAWAVDRLVLETFAPVASPDSADFQALFGMRDVSIRYGEQGRDGLFGPAMAERTVSVTVAVRVSRGEAPVVVLDLPVTSTDRIAVDDIPLVEHAALAITRGTLEGGGFFRSLAEPLVLIGSIGVAVFLLFHVRS